MAVADRDKRFLGRRGYGVGVQVVGQTSNHPAPHHVLQVPPGMAVEVIDDPASMVVAHSSKLKPPRNNQGRNTTLLHPMETVAVLRMLVSRAIMKFVP